jgi:hypothetical protein
MLHYCWSYFSSLDFNCCSTTWQSQIISTLNRLLTHPYGHGRMNCKLIIIITTTTTSTTTTTTMMMMIIIIIIIIKRMEFFSNFAHRYRKSRSTYEVWSKISGTKFFIQKLLIVLKWQPCRTHWQHLLTPHTRGVDGNLTQWWVSWSTVQLCLSLRLILWNGCVDGATCLHWVLPETW